MTLAAAPTRLHRLHEFVAAFGALVADAPDEGGILGPGAELLRALVATDGWLPDSHAIPNPARYTQYLLHLDPAARFSVVSFVWGPGQATPVHDHRTWGLVGVLRGAELVESFRRDADGGLVSLGLPALLGRGEVDAVSPTIGDLHRVANAFDHRVSISIHVYGGDIGRIERATYDAAGRPTRFVSGYTDAPALEMEPA